MTVPHPSLDRRRSLIQARVAKIPCKHLGRPTGDVKQCIACGQRHLEVALISCGIYGTCSVDGETDGVKYCMKCNDYDPVTESGKAIAPSSLASSVETSTTVPITPDLNTILSRQVTQSPPPLVLRGGPPTRLTNEQMKSLLDSQAMVGRSSAAPPTLPAATVVAPISQDSRLADQEQVHQTTVKTVIRSSQTSSIGRKITWAYGVTTVPSRRDYLLPKTLQSLRDAGFDAPRLFVDGESNYNSYRMQGIDNPITVRWPAVRAYGNWILALLELYIRNHDSQCFALFQDDLIITRNTRQYLERCNWPKNGYMNLYTFPCNHDRIPSTTEADRTLGGKVIGWHESDQRGQGAVGLVFSNEAVRKLLSSQHMVDRVMDPKRGHRAIDGGVVDAMRKAGYREYVHHPSLVQHIGDVSAIGNNRQPQSPSWQGEDFDALSLLP